MSKNLIPEIAQMLGVELGEEFKIDTSGDDIFQITESGVWMRKGIDKGEWVEKPFEFVMLCNGDAEIIRLPWKPKMYEEYWTFGKLGKQWTVGTLSWKELPYEILLLGKGWVYRTRAEAKTALPAVAKEMGV
jgi:hypothetical protein